MRGEPGGLEADCRLDGWESWRKRSRSSLVLSTESHAVPGSRTREGFVERGGKETFSTQSHAAMFLSYIGGTFVALQADNGTSGY